MSNTNDFCITPKIYNESHLSWDRVHVCLKGTWHDADVSIDFIQLLQENWNLKDT